MNKKPHKLFSPRISLIGLPLGKKVGKVDMTRGYMKYDIKHSIVLLRKIMGLPAMGHLNI